MIIKFSKQIYSKESIYGSTHLWNDYIEAQNINEDKIYYYVTIKKIENIEYIAKEYSNYVLDVTSSNGA